MSSSAPADLELRSITRLYAAINRAAPVASWLPSPLGPAWPHP